MKFNRDWNEEHDGGDNVGTEALDAGSQIACEGTAASSRVLHSYSGKIHQKKSYSEKLKNRAGNPDGDSGPLVKKSTAETFESGAAESATKAAKEQGKHDRAKADAVRKQKEKEAEKHAFAKKEAENWHSGQKTEDGIRGAGKRALGKIRETFGKAGEFVAEHPMPFIIGTILGLIFAAIVCNLGSCAASAPGGAGSILGTSYTAEDVDVIRAEDDYLSLEEALAERITSVSREYPGYDEYRFDLDEFEHDPYMLAAILTMDFDAYKEPDPDVQARLEEILEEQYELTFTPVEETRTRYVERTGSRTVYDEALGTNVQETYTYREEESYPWHVLQITLRNHTLEKVVENEGFTEDEHKRYEVMHDLKGNRPYLFDSDTSVARTEIPEDGSETNPYEYEPSGDAMHDSDFAAMLYEAEKYLGRAYVWGGSSPSTGFDCSGFVCWVINKSGVGSVGRTTADGLRQWTTTIPKSERQPGDIVYFQGTYNTAGASHVGIYVGDGKMIHCGNPIKYSNIDSGYFAEHFMCYGRIPD